MFSWACFHSASGNIIQVVDKIQLFANFYQRTSIKLILGKHKVARNHCLVAICSIILRYPHVIISTQAQNGKIRATIITCSVTVRDRPPDD